MSGSSHFAACVQVLPLQQGSMLSPVILQTSAAGDYFSPRTCCPTSKSSSTSRRSPTKPLTPVRAKLEWRQRETWDSRLPTPPAQEPFRRIERFSLLVCESLSPPANAYLPRRSITTSMSYYETTNGGGGGGHLSSVAPRAPLPGYDHRDSRSPPQEVGDVWGPTSPPRSAAGGGGSHDGWGQNAAPPPSSSSNNHPSFPTTNNPPLVPRAPQTLADPSRRNNAASDYGPPEPAGGGGPPSSTLSPAQSSKEAFIRIRILGIDRQKKDMYIKFNAEVSLLRELWPLELFRGEEADCVSPFFADQPAKLSPLVLCVLISPSNRLL